MVPPFSSFDQAQDRFEDLAWGQVLVTPFELGAPSLLRGMELNCSSSFAVVSRIRFIEV
jgi:hypothetical protein